MAVPFQMIIPQQFPSALRWQWVSFKLKENQQMEHNGQDLSQSFLQDSGEGGGGGGGEWQLAGAPSHMVLFWRTHSGPTALFQSDGLAAGV